MKVKFLPQNVEFDIPADQSVMNLAHEKGLPIKSICNGMPSCAECRVRVVDGEYNVAPPSRKELSLIGTGYHIDQRRLSCQLYCFGDVTVDLSEQLEREAESPLPKKFLARAQKEGAEQYHSVGDVLLEKDGDLIKAAEQEAQAPRAPSQSGTPNAGPAPDNRPRDERQGGGRGGRGRRRRR